MNMEFRTKIDIERSASQIAPCARMLFVGSCFADSIGKRFEEERFPVTVNPFGTMYNPVSVWHTVEKVLANDDAGEKTEWVFITLGTNHIYILKETGEVVDSVTYVPTSVSKTNYVELSLVVPCSIQRAKLRFAAWKSIVSNCGMVRRIKATSVNRADVNRDGEVSIADINAIINVILDINDDPELILRADVNDDGEVNVSDVNKVIEVIQG